jgi:hypothetical protein
MLLLLSVDSANKLSCRLFVLFQKKQKLKRRDLGVKIREKFWNYLSLEHSEFGTCHM